MGKKRDELLKNKNISKILELIKESGGISRAELAKLTSLTPASITKLSKKLLDIELIKEVGLGSSSGGRPPRILKLNNKGGNIISLYFAPDFIELVIFDLDMNRVFYEKKEIWILTKSKVLTLAKNMVKRSIKEANNDLLGIGIAINGIVDAKRGMSIYSPHYKWSNVDLVAEFEAEFSLKTFIDNDVRAMAIGEKEFGLGKEIESFVLVNIGNGVGAGLYLNEEIYRGFSNGAGEFGHIPIEGNKRRCSCGKKGCLETLITSEALEEIYYYESGNEISIEEIYSLYKQGTNKIAKRVIEEFVAMFAKGLVPLINILNPQGIIVAGHMNLGGASLYKLLEKEVNARAFGDLARGLIISPASNEDESASIGAACMLLDKVFKN